ncbi:MAG: sigma-70 family RNA polymerase sigma factor [Candidatus Omnitrophica bacterium]|nr:sigma-70 family RNA polymerase sigma factor [Candidatus Omnitrophota bacterium]
MKTGLDDSDISLVEGCIERDLVSWSALVKKYSHLIAVSIDNRLRKYGFNLPREDVEDIRQEVLKSLWKGEKFRLVRNRRDISYWLSIVAGNEAIQYMRKIRGMDEPRLISTFENLGENSVEELIESGRASPPEELERRDIAKRIESEINSLPSKEKLVMKLNILYDKKYDEIADILNMPAGTVSSYIKRAKEKLKKKLKYLQ